LKLDRAFIRSHHVRRLGSSASIGAGQEALKRARRRTKKSSAAMKPTGENTGSLGSRSKDTSSLVMEAPQAQGFEADAAEAGEATILNVGASL
jgi:hypothetical protein